MSSHDDFYKPEQVDEQLEAILRTGRASEQDLSMIETLLFDLSRRQEQVIPMDESGKRALERVLTQLLHEEKKLSIERTRLPLSLPAARTMERKKGQTTMKNIEDVNIEDVNIKEGSLPSIQPGKVTPKKRMPGLLRLLAAVLVCVVLIGSLALVLNTSRSKAPATINGSKHGVTPTATGSLHCVNTTDLAEQALCTSGQETMLNLPVTINKDQITFVRAYADAQRVILIYSAPEALPLDLLFRGLETRQGDLGSDPGLPIHLKTTLYEIDFMGDVLAGNVTQLQVQGITVLGPMPPGGIPLQFTLSVHTGRQVVSINQTRTTDGISLTVKSVIITAATTTFTIVFNPVLTVFETSTSPTFILAGQTFAWHSYQEQVGSASGPGQEQTFALDLVGLVHSGINTLQVQAGTSNTGAMTPTTAPLTTHTWNFQFTV